MASERCTAAVAAVPTAVAAAAPRPIHVAVDRRVALDGGADHQAARPPVTGAHIELARTAESTYCWYVVSWSVQPCG